MFAPSTGEYLQEYREQIKSVEESENKVELINALLNSTDGKYNRLGLYFSQIEVNRIKNLFRQSLGELIHNQTIYTVVRDDDILMENTKQVLSNINKLLLDKVKEKLSEISNFDDAEYFLSSITTARTKLIKGASTFSQDELVTKLRNFVESINITLPDHIFKHLSDALHNENTTVVSLSPLECITTAVDSISRAKKGIWENFLDHLYKILSEYDVQKNVSAYNVANISDWGQLNRPQGIFINEINFKEFINTQPEHFWSLKNMTVSPFKYTQLNNILRITLKKKINVESNTTLIVKGEYVKLSDIDFSTKCPSTCDSVHIFAVNTFFADANVILHHIKEFSIVAHKWVIVYPIVIDISAADNTKIPEEPYIGTLSSSAGIPGKPGDPGYNGANFFGYANEVVNEEVLIINVNGGTGARGQNGSPAFNELASMPVSESTTYGSADGLDILKKYASSSYDTPRIIDSGSQSHDSKLKRLQDAWSTESATLEYVVLPRQCCRHDGLAGAGGLGGRPGNVLILVKDNFMKSVIINNEGSIGLNGINVKPCKTKGRHVDYNVKCRTELLTSWSVVPEPSIQILECSGSFKAIGTRNDIYCGEANPYTKFNEENKKLPGEVKRISVGSIINDYKSFLRLQLKSSFRKEFVHNVYESTESTDKINSLYTIEDFISELNSYERQFYELHNDVDFLPFYKGYLKRIEEYGDRNENVTNTNDRRVLAWLYTTALSKATALRNNEDFNLIIDVEGYFELVVGNVRKLKELGHTKVVNDLRSKYITELNDKIDEANKFIIESVQPTIKNSIKEVEQEMDVTMNELISKENSTIDDIAKKIKDERKLRNNVALRKALGVLDVIGTGLSVAGPYGQLAGSVINVGTEISRSHITDPDDEESSKITVPSGVKDINQKLGDIYAKRKKKQIDALNEEIEKLDNEFNADEEVKNDVKIDGKFDELKQRLRVAKEQPSPNQQTIDDITKDMKTLIEQQKEGLKKNVTIKEKTQEKATKWFERSQIGIQVISESFELYEKFKEDDKKLEEAAKAITDAEEKLKSLQQFEKTIYNELVPSIHGMAQHIESARVNLGTKSKIALNIEQWRIKQVFRETRDILLTALTDFSNKATVKNCIDEIDEAFAMLIKIYEGIENYQEQTKFAVYSAALHTADISDFHFNDSNTQTKFDDLRINVQVNVIAGQFLDAMNGFKQNAFPFAAFYLSIYKLPTVLSTAKDVNEVVTATVPMLEQLIHRIRALNATVINKNDADIHSVYFNSENAAIGPFYVWHNNAFGATIADLLAGKRVYLKADVTKGLQLNAVKFNRIGIEFRTENKSLEAELRAILQPFQISLMHLGISYYRCGNRFYTISSPVQHIQYSYEKIGDTPNDRNGVYQKLSAGNVLLSPYTLWSLQLKNGDFEKLKPYAQLVNLELFGHGNYVDWDAKICNSDLEQYYEVDKSISGERTPDEDDLYEVPISLASHTEIVTDLVPAST